MKLTEITAQPTPATSAATAVNTMLGASDSLQGPAQRLAKNPDFRHLASLDSKFARRLSIAWEGDMHEVAAHGTAAATMVPRLLSTGSLRQLTSLDPAAIATTVSALLAQHARDADEVHRDAKKYNNIWGSERWVKENAANFQQLIAEIRAELENLK